MTDLMDTDRKIVEHVLKALEPMLHEGSRGRLQHFVQNADGHPLPASAAVPKLLDHLMTTEHGARNFKPGVVETTGSAKTRDFRAKLADGTSGLSLALKVLPLKAAARETLAAELGYDYGTFTAGEAAGQLVGKFSDRAFREKSLPADYQVPPPPAELRMKAILADRFSDVLNAEEQDSYARRSGASIGTPEHLVVNAVAKVLGAQGRLPHDDPRRDETAPIVATEPVEHTRSFVV